MSTSSALVGRSASLALVDRFTVNRNTTGHKNPAQRVARELTPVGTESFPTASPAARAIPAMVKNDEAIENYLASAAVALQAPATATPSHGTDIIYPWMQRVADLQAAIGRKDIMIAQQNAIIQDQESAIARHQSTIAQLRSSVDETNDALARQRRLHPVRDARMLHLEGDPVRWTPERGSASEALSSAGVSQIPSTGSNMVSPFYEGTPSPDPFPQTGPLFPPSNRVDAMHHPGSYRRDHTLSRLRFERSSRELTPDSIGAPHTSPGFVSTDMLIGGRRVDTETSLPAVPIRSAAGHRQHPTPLVQSEMPLRFAQTGGVRGRPAEFVPYQGASDFTYDDDDDSGLI